MMKSAVGTLVALLAFAGMAAAADVKVNVGVGVPAIPAPPAIVVPAPPPPPGVVVVEKGKHDQGKHLGHYKEKGKRKHHKKKH